MTTGGPLRAVAGAQDLEQILVAGVIGPGQVNTALGQHGRRQIAWCRRHLGGGRSKQGVAIDQGVRFGNELKVDLRGAGIDQHGSPVGFVPDLAAGDGRLEEPASTGPAQAVDEIREVVVLDEPLVDVAVS